MAALVVSPVLLRRIPNMQYHATLREKRLGVMLHYDESGTDEGSMRWFEDSRCRVSYNFLVLDDGRYVQIAPPTTRAWHAGFCRSSDPERLPYQDANSAFYGIAVATNGKTGCTEAARLTAAWLARWCFEKEGWHRDETWRIVGHDTEAVYPAGHAKAGQRGRKIDPTGPVASHPILSVEDVRYLAPRFAMAAS